MNMCNPNEPPSESESDSDSEIDLTFLAESIAESMDYRHPFCDECDIYQVSEIEIVGEVLQILSNKLNIETDLTQNDFIDLD